MYIEVKKLTGVELLRKANSFTTGHESKMSLATAYRCGHTVIRTQMFEVECYGIPQFVAYHLRTHFTIHPMPPYEYGWMRSKRVDKGAPDFKSECNAIANAIEGDYDVKETRSLCQLMSDLRSLPERFDRYAPTDFFFTVSAEGLMTLAHSRLCCMASKETREVMKAICELVEEQDPDLFRHLVPQCVYRGGICPELRCCGYIHSQSGQKALENYRQLFTDKK